MPAIQAWKSSGGFFFSASRMLRNSIRSDQTNFWCKTINRIHNHALLHAKTKLIYSGVRRAVQMCMRKLVQLAKRSARGCAGRHVRDHPPRVIYLGVCIKAEVPPSGMLIVSVHAIVFFGGKTLFVRTAYKRACLVNLESKPPAMKPWGMSNI